MKHLRSRVRRGTLLCLALFLAAFAPFAALAQELTLELEFTLNGRGRGTFTFQGETIVYRHSVRPGRRGEYQYPADVTVNGLLWEDLDEPFQLSFTPDFEKTVIIEREGRDVFQIFPYPDRVDLNYFDSDNTSKIYKLKLAVKNQISRAAASAASSASGPGASNASAGSVFITPEQKAIAAALNRQGFRMLQSLGDEKETANKFISPYSIDSAFAMLYAGVGGRSANQIRDVLGLPVDPLDSSTFFHAMSGQYRASRQADVLVSNSAWVDRSARLRPEYARKLETYFEGAFYTEDFSKGEAVARKINSLVESKTKGMIKDLLAPSA